METKIEKLKESRIRATTVVTDAEKNAAEAKALERLSEQVNIKGFRAGKAPADMVRGRVTKEQLMEETVRVLLPDIMKKALDESKAKPILRPAASVTAVAPLTIALTFVERPPVSLKKPDSIKVEKKTMPAIDPKEIESFVRKVMMQDRVENPVERAVQAGDMVRMSMTAEKKGKPVDELTVGNYTLTLGAEDLLPELEPHLIGMKKDDKKKVDVTFPKTHEIPAIRGEKIAVEMTVKGVSEVKLPELTPEYLKTRLGAERTPDAFRAEVREMLTQRKRSDEMRRREEELYDKVRAATSVELAPELIDAEVQEMVADLHDRLQRQGMTMEQWLETTGKKSDAVIEEMKGIASSRIVLRFGMQELANKLGVEPNKDDVKSRLKQEADQAAMQNQPFPPEELLEGGSLYDRVHFELKMQQLIDKMISDEKESVKKAA